MVFIDVFFVYTTTVIELIVVSSPVQNSNHDVQKYIKKIEKNKKDSTNVINFVASVWVLLKVNWSKEKMTKLVKKSATLSVPACCNFLIIIFIISKLLITIRSKIISA